MRIAVLSLILFFMCGSRLQAQESPVFVAIVEPRALREYINSLRYLKKRSVRFKMSEVVANNKSLATASIVGPFEELDLPIVLRTLAFGSIVRAMDGPWKLVVTGDNHAIRVLVEPVAKCSNSSSEQWFLSKQGNRWIMIERAPSMGIKSPRCEPVF